MAEGEIESFGRAKHRWFQALLTLPSGISSHGTFGRVFAGLNPAAFETAFRDWVRMLTSIPAGEVVAIDGMALRRSHDRTAGRDELETSASLESATTRRVNASQTTDSYSVADGGASPIAQN